MQDPRPSLFARDDTFFGVCEALGNDLGFNPVLLRVALPLLLFINPVAAIGGYAAAGAIVLLSRTLFPDPRPVLRWSDAEEERSREAEQEAVEPQPVPLAA